jgi:hypothetical protein
LPSVAAVGAKDRLFYSAMAVAMASTVFVGFAPSYYLRVFRDGSMVTVSGGPFTALVHVHGALFTGWVLLFVVQTSLVATRRVAIHRRLGVAGAVLAAAMVIVGTLTAIATAARGAAPPGIDPLTFLVIPLFDMALFTAFVIGALVKRRDKETHKRLMLLAYTSIIVAAAARLPGVLALGPPRVLRRGVVVHRRRRPLRPCLARAGAQGLHLGRTPVRGLGAAAFGALGHRRVARVCGAAHQSHLRRGRPRLRESFAAMPTPAGAQMRMPACSASRSERRG